MTASPWVVFPRPEPRAEVRLFCFPYAGAGAAAFAPWARALPPSIEVCGVQPPGRAARLAEPAFGAIDPLVDALYAALLPFFDRPFAFFGHSSGALMAFELARRLRREERPLPRHLFAGGRRAPQVAAESPPIYALPDAEFIAALRDFEGTPQEVLDHEELMRLVLPTLRADFSLGDTYVYRDEAPLDVPITAMAGERDRHVSIPAAEAWAAQTSGRFELKLYDGDHFFLHTDQARVLADLADALRTRPG